MSKKAPLLSICLPTYNNPEKFERLLRSLAPQLTDEVELIIRDDSDNDETKKLVSKLQRELFKNHKLDYNAGKKEGLDIAIHFLTKTARGKYVWWIGDDDVIDTAVPDVTTILRHHNDITLLILNAQRRSQGDKSLQLGDSRYFTDRNEVLEHVVDLLGFISITIFSQKLAATGLAKSEKFKGTAWVNLFIIMHVLSQEGKSFYLDTPCVIGDPRDHSRPVWYDGFTVFALNFFDVLTEFKHSFTAHSFKAALADNLRGIMRGIFVFRAKGYTHGLGSRDPKILPLLKYYWNYFEFWKNLPLLLIPRPLASLLYRVVRPQPSSQIL